MSGHTKTTCKTMLQEDVKENLALVKSLKLSSNIAQCKLCKEEERLAEVELDLASTSGAEIASPENVEFKKERNDPYGGKGNWREDALAEEREAKVKANTKGKGKFS